MPRSKSSRRSYRKKGFIAKKRGGAQDSQSYVTGVVGQYPHSAQAGSNIIAQHPYAENPVPVPVPPQQGGSSVLSSAPIGGAYLPKAVGLARGGKKGGSLLSEVAVPAVLLIANQTLGKKTGKRFPHFGKRHSRKQRGSRFYRR